MLVYEVHKSSVLRKQCRNIHLVCFVHVRCGVVHIPSSYNFLCVICFKHIFRENGYLCLIKRGTVANIRGLNL